MKNAIPLAFVLSISLIQAREIPPATTLTAPSILLFPKEYQVDEQRIFQGIPGLERISNGRLWAVWYGGGETEDLDNIIMLNTSNDDGQTWSELKIVIDIERPVRCFDPVIWLDPKKRLWIFWAQAIPEGDNRDSQTWAMVTKNPEDENPTWEKPFVVHPGVMMNKPTVLSSGEWLLPISDWEGRRLLTPDASTSAVIISQDEGKTFAHHGAAFVPVEDRKCDEQMVVERHDGSLLMWLRTNSGIGEATSNDKGKTWSAMTHSEVTHPSSRFFLRRLQSGNLLLIKHWPINQKLDGRNQLMAFVSKDDGETWEGSLMLDERGGVSYPDGVEGDDGIIRIIYDFDRHGSMEILMASFTEEDVLSSDNVSGKVKLRTLVNKATGTSIPNLGLRDNSDGDPLLTGNPATWNHKEEDFLSLQIGAQIFRNRPYTLHTLPDELKGAHFVKNNIEQWELSCSEDGVAYVLTASEGRNDDSQHQALLDLGFSLASLREFNLFQTDSPTSNFVSVYQKSFKAGDQLNVGKWGVLVIPSTTIID